VATDARRLGLYCAQAIGWSLILVWGSLWYRSHQANHLTLPRPAFYAFEYLGVDFYSSYYATRHWFRGGDPYTEPYDDPLDRALSYPPSIQYAFAWTRFFSARKAMRVWFAFQVVICVGAVLYLLRCRQVTGRERLPVPLMVGLFLFCLPVIFALERGNWDLALVPWLCGFAWFLDRPGRRAGLYAGLCLTAAAWLKFYPVLLFGVLVYRRRWTGVFFFVSFSLILAALFHKFLPAMVENLQTTNATNRPAIFYPGFHSLTGYWPLLSTSPDTAWLLAIPKFGAAVILIVIPCLVVFFIAVHSPNAKAVTTPLVLWLTAAFTFLPEVANDYNLVFLPLAMLVIWRPSHPWWLQGLFAYALLAYSPLQMPVDARLLFFCKLMGVYATGLAILHEAGRACVSETAAAPKLA
jgi:hypothetical protein